MSLVVDPAVTLSTASPSVSLLQGLQQVTEVPLLTFVDNSALDSDSMVYIMTFGNETQTANSSSKSTAEPLSSNSLANLGMTVGASKCSLAVCAMLLLSILTWL